MLRYLRGFILVVSISLLITSVSLAVVKGGGASGASKVSAATPVQKVLKGKLNKNATDRLSSLSAGGVREKKLANGRIQRSEDLDSNGKYPYLRRTELLDGDSKSGGLKVVSSRTFVADHLIVRLAAGKSEKDLSAALKKLGSGWSIRRQLKSGALLIAFPADDPNNFDRYMEALKGSAAVKSVDSDYVVSIMSNIPNDVFFGDLWGMDNTGQAGGKVDADIDAPEAWDITTGRKVIRIGLIDTGIDYTHPDLAANIWTNPGEIPANNIDDDGNGYKDDIHGWDFANNDSNPMDDHSHGTHCSGTMAGIGNNYIGVTGVNWTSELVAMKFLDDGGSGFVSDAVDAIYYSVAMGCKLTSNSWGGGDYSPELATAIEYANSKGCLFIAAAGNETNNNDASPAYPASYTSDNIIAVAAIDHNDVIASFSNYGLSSVDLGAPGVSIYSTVLSGGYTTYSGTSMATPHVSGVVALMWSQAPAMGHHEIRQRLLNNVDPIASLAGKCATGGRLNAYKAVSGMPTTYPSYARHEIIDSAPGGNGDVVLNPGEQASLRVAIANLCPVSVSNVAATLTISDPSVTVVNGSAVYGTIAPDSEAFGQTDFVIQVQPSAVTPRQFTCQLVITASGGGPWTYTFTEEIHRSCVVSGSVTRDGTGLADISIAVKGGYVESSTVTDADGNYSLTLADGSQTITCTAPGKTKFICPDPITTNINASVTLNFAFVSAYVSGRVTNGDTGEGVSGASVIWSGDISGSDTTGAAGNYSVRFSVAIPKTATLRLKARLEGVFVDTPVTTVVIPPSVVADFELRPPQYVVEDVAELLGIKVEPLDDDSTPLAIEGLNNNGEMVGYHYREDWYGSPTGYRMTGWYYDGIAGHWLTDADPNAQTCGDGISDNGWITGFIFWPDNPDLSCRGLIIKPDGSRTLLEHLGSVRWDNGAFPEEINDSGTVVGAFMKSNWNDYPVVWEDGQIRPLLCPGDGGEAYDINRAGLIAGSIASGQAVIWTATDRITLPDALAPAYVNYGVSANCLNNNSLAVGAQNFYREGGYWFRYAEPLVWNNGSVSILPIMDAPEIDSPLGRATGVNDNNQIVGYCLSPDSSKRNEYCAVMWENGVLTDLNTLILASEGWHLSKAFHINDAGQIGGEGYHDGKFTCFLLSPKDLPPKAFITAAPSSGPPPLTVHFDSAGSTDKEGTIVSYAWVFGDGATQTGGTTAVHTYTASGTFTASLTVTDNSGKTGKREVTISTVAPDLVMTTGTATLTTTGKLTVNATVSNNGTVDAPAGFDAGAWLSADSVLDGSDRELWSTVRSTALTMGSSWSSTSTITGSNITPGAWHVLIATDSGHAVQELSETNNIVDVPMELRPNLFVSSASWTVSGGNVGGTFKIKNDGFAKLPGSARAGLYLSADDNVTNTDYLCGTYTTTSAGLDYTEMDTKTISFAIPGNVPAGTYTLGIIADDNGQVIESDETDNVKTRATPVTVTGGTLPGQASSPSPADGAGGVGLDADLSWTAGSGTTSHDVYFGTTNTPPLAASNITATSYQLPTLSISTMYYWRITEKNSAGSTAGALWSFTTVSGKASNPSPSNGANNVDAVSADLSWTAGIGATSHDVYFGTTSSPLFIGNQTSTVYDLNNSGYNWPDLETLAGHWLIVCPPGDCGNADLNSDGMVDLIDYSMLGQSWMVSSPVLEAGKTYYWRIDEHNAGGTVTGDLWSFATAGGTPECLVSHWKLDETSGTTAADSTGNGHTGTLIEGTAGSLVWSAGHIGGALSFDGDGPSNNVNSFCRVAVPTTGLSVSSGTVALWAKIAASGPNNYSARNNGIYLFGAKGGTTNDRILISTIATDLGLDIGIGSETVNNASLLTRSSWYHIALTWDSNVYTLYVNGQSVKTGSFGSLTSLPAADIGNRGESTYNQSMHGLMDDVRIYSCALTAEAIAALAGQ